MSMGMPDNAIDKIDEAFTGVQAIFFAGAGKEMDKALEPLKGIFMALMQENARLGKLCRQHGIDPKVDESRAGDRSKGSDSNRVGDGAGAGVSSIDTAPGPSEPSSPAPTAGAGNKPLKNLRGGPRPRRRKKA